LRSDVIATFVLAATLGCAANVTPSPAPAPAAAPTQTPVPETSVADPGERFSLRPGESMRIRGEPVALTFQKITSDNRCAVDVVCVTGGEARGMFWLARQGQFGIQFEIGTENPAVVANGYAITLRSVSPAPLSTVTIDPASYVVEVTVSPPS
jgi:hypothetical protein